jgi:hypothetical protein
MLNATQIEPSHPRTLGSAKAVPKAVKRALYSHTGKEAKMSPVALRVLSVLSLISQKLEYVSVLYISSTTR